MIALAQPPTVIADHAPAAGVSAKDAAKALRLGWMMAEVRGRIRPGGPAVGTRAPGTEARTTLLLAEADERSCVERQVEAVKVLASVALDLDADFDIARMTDQDPKDFANAEKATEGLRFLASRLIYARNPADDVCATPDVPPLLAAEMRVGADHWWGCLSRFIWAWDENIQDALAAGEFGTASAYELGRGLSEAYWALDDAPNAPYPQSWGFLLGANRVETLTVLCDRLKPTIGTARRVRSSAASE